jgi:hypothetical protein
MGTSLKLGVVHSMILCTSHYGTTSTSMWTDKQCLRSLNRGICRLFYYVRVVEESLAASKRFRKDRRLNAGVGVGAGASLAVFTGFGIRGHDTIAARLMVGQLMIPLGVRGNR